MNLDALVLAISIICKFNDPLVSRAEKEACMEYFVNCSMDSKGQTSPELLEACIKRVTAPEETQPTPGIKARPKR